MVTNKAGTIVAGMTQVGITSVPLPIGFTNQPLRSGLVRSNVSFIFTCYSTNYYSIPNYKQLQKLLTLV